MQPRMNNPVMIVPGAMQALQRLGVAARRAGVPETTLYLLEARASQINGCSVCLDMHSRELKAAGEPDERIFMVGAWREAPYFSDAERAALALTEAVTTNAGRRAARDARAGGAIRRRPHARHQPPPRGTRFGRPACLRRSARRAQHAGAASRGRARRLGARPRR